MGSTGSSSFISCPLADHDEITVDDFCFSRNAPSVVVAWVRQLLRAIGNHQIGHLRQSTIDARRVDNNHNQTKPCRRWNDTSPHKPELVEQQRWQDRRIQPGALLPPLPNTAVGRGTLWEVLPPWAVQGPLRERSVFAVCGLCCPGVLSRNPTLSRPVRFNMQQTLLLDIALIFPSLLGRMGGAVQLPAVLANSGSNFVYLAPCGERGVLPRVQLDGEGTN